MARRAAGEHRELSRTDPGGGRRVGPPAGGGLPVTLILQPRAHHDLADLPTQLAAELGPLVAALAAAIEALPSVGRAHLARWGDGGAHLHLWLLGRPARAAQFRGSTLLDWEENLPRVPPAVAAVNARFVAGRLAAAYGGVVCDPEPGPAAPS